MSERYRGVPDPKESSCEMERVCDSKVRDDQEDVHKSCASDLVSRVVPFSLGLGLHGSVENSDVEDKGAQKDTDNEEHDPVFQADNALRDSWWGTWDHWDLKLPKRED